MDLCALAVMAGGLALFLCGMRMLGAGLADAAGGRLEQILAKLTDSPYKAVLAGAGVTAVIQSSSAVTVLTVEFVDAGLIRLRQAAGVIMGANIGTTVTSWILGAAGSGSGRATGVWDQGMFAALLAAVGAGWMIWPGTKKHQNAAVTLIGFAVLLYGMDTMSGAVRSFAELPELERLLRGLSDPVRAMLAGLAVTAVIQSSSASVGMLQALCATGKIPYGVVVPVLLGQNIGTCVTALLSCVGSGRNARCAALVHLYFNVIGSVLFLAGGYAVRRLTPLDCLEKPADGIGIALLHSLFNIGTTLILLPFSEELVRLSGLTLALVSGEGARKKGTV